MVVWMEYGNEGMDLKKLLIFMMRKFWIIVLAAVVGAFLGGGIYLLHHVALDSNREYQAESKVYLDFASDESGEVYQHYNGYTWNDLMSTSLILDATMSYLPDDYMEEEVVDATSAEILSDIRLLTVTVTTPDIERTARIIEATDKSLVELGQREKEFIDIEVIKETEPKMLVAAPRLLQAVLVGLVIALASALIAMAFIYILDDRIYVPGDLRCVTGLLFVGFDFTKIMIKPGNEIEPADKEKLENKINSKGKGKSGNEVNSESKEKLENELEQYDEEKLSNGIKSDDKINVGRYINLTARLQRDLEQNKTYLTKKLGELATLELGKGEITEQEFEKARNAKALILAIPYGKIDRSSLAYRIEQLTLQDCRPMGIIIKDADMRFMKWYYNHL